MPNSECKEHMCTFDTYRLRRLIDEIASTEGYIEEFIEEFVYVDNKGAPTLIKLPCLLAIIEKRN